MAAKDFTIENGVLEKYIGHGGDVIIPDGVTGIGDFAFDGCRDLASVVVPDSVESIGSCAFRSCIALKIIKLPNRLTSIGEQAFSDCWELISITVPNGVEKIEKKTFMSCSKMESAVLPNTITSIGDMAFHGCQMLKSIAISKNLEKIGVEAFFDCRNLTEISLPERVTTIGKEAFRCCKCLADSDGFVIVHGILFDYTGSDKNIMIPNHVSKISDEAFHDHHNLKCVTIPKEVSEIASHAFSEVWPARVIDFFPQDIFAPQVSLDILSHAELDEIAVSTFIKRASEYTDPVIVLEYTRYISAHKKKLLPEILAADSVECLELLANEKKIAKKDLEPVYIAPAARLKANRCLAFLEKLAGKNYIPVTDPQPAEDHDLWDGEHFSLDGKTLIKYQDEAGRTNYDIPVGTKRIESGAFYGCRYLKRVNIPETVSTICGHAFSDSGIDLVFLPRTLKRMSKHAFKSMSDYGTVIHEQPFVICHYPDFLDKLKNPIYLGDISELPVNVRSKATSGFVYAESHHILEIRPYRESYISFIRNNRNTYIKRAMTDENLLVLMLREQIPSEKEVSNLMKEISPQSRAELTATLLEYMNSHSIPQPALELTLEESTADKREIEIKERREKVKEQKGIVGLAFVASGDLSQFGTHDIYTGAIDRSELKVFIEERGGFLRSSVSRKTDYLICNDPNSQSTKAKVARQLGVPVITEQEFLKMAEE